MYIFRELITTKNVFCRHHVEDVEITRIAMWREWEQFQRRTALKEMSNKWYIISHSRYRQWLHCQQSLSQSCHVPFIKTKENKLIISTLFSSFALFPPDYSCTHGTQRYMKIYHCYINIGAARPPSVACRGCSGPCILFFSLFGSYSNDSINWY